MDNPQLHSIFSQLLQRNPLPVAASTSGDSPHTQIVSSILSHLDVSNQRATIREDQTQPNERNPENVRNENNAYAVVVLGMHRSGTSAVAGEQRKGNVLVSFIDLTQPLCCFHCDVIGILEKMGFYVGEYADVIPPNHDNEKGTLEDYFH